MIKYKPLTGDWSIGPAGPNMFLFCRYPSAEGPMDLWLTKGTSTEEIVELALPIVMDHLEHLVKITQRVERWSDAKRQTIDFDPIAMGM